MRAETKAMRNIQSMYERLHLDAAIIMRKTKLLLSIYRDVVWACLRSADDFCESVQESFGRDLGAALTYLNDFAPTEKRQAFEAKVSGLFETAWYVELIDMAMGRLYSYHSGGRLYHEILSKAYISALAYSENDMLETLDMERSTYYEKKKEAILLLGIALWAHTIPRMNEIHESASEEAALLPVSI